MGYTPRQAEDFVGRLEARRGLRQDRDEILADVEKAVGEEKLRAGRAALNFLTIEIESPVPRDDGTYVLGLAEFYEPLLRQPCARGRPGPGKRQGLPRAGSSTAHWDRRDRAVIADAHAGPEAWRALAQGLRRRARRLPVQRLEPRRGPPILSGSV